MVSREELFCLAVLCWIVLQLAALEVRDWWRAVKALGQRRSDG